jgi:radical SAM superfamily enzyme YgiQ (UPF0313 family)
MKTIGVCRDYSVHLMVFFMIGLANETRETVKETWRLWEKICSIDKAARTESLPVTVNYSFGPIVLLDPGSLAFDSPAKYGYQLVSRNLEDYVGASALPSWHQWVSYRTDQLDRDSIVELILDSIEFSIDLREKYGVYSRAEAVKERICQVDEYRWIIKEVDRAMEIRDEDERLKKLKSLRATLDKHEAQLSFGQSR